MNIGRQPPSWKTPCLSNGRIDYVSLTANRGKPLVSCCTSTLAEIDAWLLKAQGNRFHEDGMVLGVLVSGDQWLYQHWIRPPHEFRLLFLTDPLKRFGRTLRLSSSLPSHQSETLILDQYSRLKFRLLHELNLRELATVREITERIFDLHSNPELWKKPVQSERLPAHHIEAEKGHDFSTIFFQNQSAHLKADVNRHSRVQDEMAFFERFLFN